MHYSAVQCDFGQQYDVMRIDVVCVSCHVTPCNAIRFNIRLTDYIVGKLSGILLYSHVHSYPYLEFACDNWLEIIWQARVVHCVSFLFRPRCEAKGLKWCNAPSSFLDLAADFIDLAVCQDIFFQRAAAVAALRLIGHRRRRRCNQWQWLQSFKQHQCETLCFITFV